MSNIYQSQFSRVGNDVREMFDANFIITFSDAKVTTSMLDYCLTHSHGELKQDFVVGDAFIFGGKRFSITSIGDTAITNFRELGHVTIYFDGEETARLPGTVHLLGNLPKDVLDDGCSFIIESD